MAAALIAIDWGTTSARVYRLDARGRILDERCAPLGVQTVEGGGFPVTLAARLGGSRRRGPDDRLRLDRQPPGWSALAPAGVADYLSGLLLGAEIAAARHWIRRYGVGGASMTLVGEAALCERYRQGLALAGLESAPGPTGAAARGLWHIARRAGMLAA